VSNDPKPELTPLSDPENVGLILVHDEPDEQPGMTPDEADDFLARPVPPLADSE
jgi:hypothetical protein